MVPIRLERSSILGTTATRLNEMRVGIPKKLLHVTNRLYKEGIFVQIRWTHCNKTNNFQCCQYHPLIRILPEEQTNSFIFALAVYVYVA